MNKLDRKRQSDVLRPLVEENAVRATCRITGTAKGTVLRLLVRAGEACTRFHDETVRGIATKQVQCDEIWSFVRAKAANVSPELQGTPGIGDVWTWVELDADSRLAIAWAVGKRDPETAHAFMMDLAARLSNRVQLTTDGYRMYLRAVEDAFGWCGVDYAMLIKLYGSAADEEVRYSPPRCNGTKRLWIMGDPDPQKVSTSYVERQNLTMRMQMRRFTRLTNGFSKKIENHMHAVALHFVWYNFGRPHQTLTQAAGGIRTTPAKAAGLTNRVWKMEDVLALMDSYESTDSN